MINKASVESAIILSKRLTNINKTIEVTQGSIIELLSGEFLNEEIIHQILNNPAIDIDAVIRGDESIEPLANLITQLLNGSTDQSEEGDSVIEGILQNFSESIARKVTDNLELMKGFVIPLVNKLQTTLIKTHNDVEDNINRVDINLTILPVKLNDFWDSETFRSMSSEIENISLVEPTGECPLKDKESLIDVIMNRIPEELTILKDGFTPDDMKNVVINYITSEATTESKLNNTPLNDLGLLYGFFYSIIKNSRLNNVDTEELTRRAYFHLKQITQYVNGIKTTIDQDEVNGVIISSYPAGNRDIVLRSSTSDENIVYVIGENTKDFAQLPELVGGILTKPEIPITVTKQQILNDQLEQEIITFYNDYKSKLNDYRGTVLRNKKDIIDLLIKSAVTVCDELKIVTGEKSRYEDTVKFTIEELFNTDITFDDKVFFDLSCEIIGRCLTTQHTLDVVDYIRTLDSHFEGKESVDVGFELTRFVNNQIVVFLMRQVNFY